MHIRGPLGLIPLDNRPCTQRFPRRIAEIAGLTLETPPFETLGDLLHPARIPEIRAWLRTKPWQALFVSLETLAFGGLIPSRQSEDPLELALERLSLLRELKRERPDLTIYAFGTTMRLSRHAALEEEKPYWAEYGEAFSRLSFHLDRFRQLRQPSDREAYRAALAEIPRSVRSDYLKTRHRNFLLLREMIEWAREGVFEALHLTQDDTASFGLNVAEQRALKRAAQDLPFGRFYPGADEVATTLLARFLNKEQSPTFCPVYSHPGGEASPGMYDGCSIQEAIERHLWAANATLAPEEEADFLLFANVPAQKQGDLCLGILDGIEPRDLDPFVRRLRSSIKAGKRCILADLAYANGADSSLMEKLERADFDSLVTFSAWNTAGNSLGTALAAASATLHQPNEAARTRFLLERLAEDYLYMTILRAPLRSEGDLDEAKLESSLNRAWGERFGPECFRASYPWERFFEADIQLLDPL
ncbi:MAG: DUF4127 family protein [Bacteroidota bacterium]